ncbi:hypothetical protein K0U00_23450, partial [Paenibacillus sepulcri]|nr:hypothetical protein [Paenibacillus sepulcri]
SSSSTVRGDASSVELAAGESEGKSEDESVAFGESVAAGEASVEEALFVLPQPNKATDNTMSTMAS